MTSTPKLKLLAKAYLTARHTFLKATDKIDALSDNDNIVGRIGEFIALNYLIDQGRTIIKNKNKSQKGFDMVCGERKKISVKIMTAENQTGRTTRIKEPWNELIVILLNESYEVDRIGHIHKEGFKKALKEGKRIRSKTPYTKKTMLRDNGLFQLHGRLLKGREVKKYL